MDRAPTYKERFPEWRSSDGALKEKDSRSAAKEGVDRQRDRQKNTLTGYESSEKERSQRDEPQKIYELSSSFGSLAVGRNKKKQLVIVNSQRRTKEIHQLTRESHALRRQTSVKIPLISGEFHFNEDWNRREESAYSFQLEASRSPDFFMRKMKELSDRRTLDIQEKVNPFFDLSEDKAELAYLRQRAAELSRSRGVEERSRGAEERSPETEKGLRMRIQFLTTVLADKERQRLKFYTKLPQLLEEARKEAPGVWNLMRAWREIEEETAEDGQGDEEQGEDQGED